MKRNQLIFYEVKLHAFTLGLDGDLGLVSYMYLVGLLINPTEFLLIMFPLKSKFHNINDITGGKCTNSADFSDL